MLVGIGFPYCATIYPLTQNSDAVVVRKMRHRIAACHLGRSIKRNAPRQKPAPDRGRTERERSTKLSALPPKADMCGAVADARYGPIADIIAWDL